MWVFLKSHLNLLSWQNFDILLNKIHRQVEHFLIHNANRVVRCNSWALLSADLQKKIKDGEYIMVVISLLLHSGSCD